MVADSMPKKKKRDVLGYLSPTGKIDEFAQCSTCRDKINDGNGKFRCFILDEPINLHTSCDYYVPGKGREQGVIAKRLISNEEAGFYHGDVRCENCFHVEAEKSKCGLYKHLNEDDPNLWYLDENIDLKGCCNAFTAKE